MSTTTEKTLDKDLQRKEEDYNFIWNELPNLLFIPLTKGRFAILDAEDYPGIAAFSWYTAGKYAQANAKVGRGKAQKNVLMHRVLMGFPDCRVDHKNRNGRDNRRCNLRLATATQNVANRSCMSRTGFKGVYKNSAADTFFATITSHGERHYLGCFRFPEDAAAAYDRAAVANWGEYAALNFEERKSDYLGEVTNEN